MDSCFDGKEAEEYLTAVKYDAVILDIMMPKKDGLSVLKEMRRKKDSTPVILLTAKDSVEAVSYTHLAGNKTLHQRRI